MSRVKCGYADKYKALMKPKCGCEVCELKWKVRNLQDHNASLKKCLEQSMENFDLLKGSLHDLIDDSEGVVGLHLNGDVAPWEELMEGGRFEEWLLPLTDFKM